jgi:hypothetical protein
LVIDPGRAAERGTEKNRPNPVAGMQVQAHRLCNQNHT